jgi:DNA-binding NarL/FixJ family response regulator
MLADGVPLRVMVVDDHALVRAAIRQAISSPGIEVVAEAATAAAALETAPDVAPDVILLDLRLPDRNRPVLRRLRDRLARRSSYQVSGSPRRGNIRARPRAATRPRPAGAYRAIDSIRHGQLAMSRNHAEAIRKLRGDGVAPCRRRCLTHRGEVLRLMADG